MQVSFVLRNKARALVTLIGVIALTVLVTRYRQELGQLGRYGYAGIFLACFAANSTVFLPAPSSAIVFTFATVFSPVLVALSGGLGAALGEVSGYVAGFSGRALTAHSEQVDRSRFLIRRYGAGAVFIFAFLPLPLFDLVGVAAGAARMNFMLFLLACVLGKVLKMMLYAYAGVGLLPLIEPFLRQRLAT